MENPFRESPSSRVAPDAATENTGPTTDSTVAPQNTTRQTSTLVPRRENSTLIRGSNLVSYVDVRLLISPLSRLTVTTRSKLNIRKYVFSEKKSCSVEQLAARWCWLDGRQQFWKGIGNKAKSWNGLLHELNYQVTDSSRTTGGPENHSRWVVNGEVSITRKF